jgi:hypothetical protein
MGVVYRARDPILNRAVAVKTLTARGDDSQSMLQRFYREAQSAAGLQHPHIITIYNMGDDGGVPYIAMELVDGENLDQLIARRASLPIPLKLVYAMQACSAFDYAHKRGIVHRDIKPGNVMLSKEGVVKVVDFGIARVLDTSKTQTGMLIGTFAYMSPEQYQGEHADERSDIWSFGVLLYELLVYQRPFAGTTPASLMLSICSQVPRPLRELAPEAPPELEMVLAKALQKSPGDRYQSMEDLLLDLGPICKSLQSASVAELLARSRQLVEQGDYYQARDLISQARQVDSTDPTARILLEKVNAELKRVLIKPKAQQHVERGRTLLEEGRIQAAKAEAESALQLDSGFEPAQELQKLVQREMDRAQLVSEWLESSRQRLAEGVPEEAETLLLKVLEVDPSNQAALALRQQVVNDQAARQKRLQLLDGIQQARSFWTQQNYGKCIQLLNELQKDFPGDDEIQRLLETAREDQAEQQKQEALDKARKRLAARQYDECRVLLTDLEKQFPDDYEICSLLEDLGEEEASHRRLQGLAEARGLLTARRHEECIALLTGLQKEFPDNEVRRLLQTAHEDQAERQKQEALDKARKLLAARQYDECRVLLTDLEKQFPDDDKISSLLEDLGEEEANQRRLQGLAEARGLLTARRHEECIALLTGLQKEFPDNEVRRLLQTAHEDQAEQQKQETLEKARKLLAARQYDECNALLKDLQKQFPKDDGIAKLVAAALEDQAEQRKLQGLAQARNLLASRSHGESIELLTSLAKEFPGEVEITKLREMAREEQAEQQKQQKLVEARFLLAAQQFDDALEVLDALRATHPKDTGVSKLRTLIAQEREKLAKSKRMQKELEALKKLVSGKKYSEVLARGKELIDEFPGNADLARLVDYARSQQAQREKETSLRKSLETVEQLLAASRFAEAIREAEDGLKAFPENPQLLLLRHQAELQQKKLETHQFMEQRIREIKIKINRQKFSDAINLAKETLDTMGPDTDVSQLLNSALVEHEAQEKQRKQEKALESIRTLVESGKSDEASQALDDSLANRVFDTYDSRVNRAVAEIQAAKAAAETPGMSAAPTIPPGDAAEYAFQQASSLPPSTATPEKGSPAEAPPAAQASAIEPLLSAQPVSPAPAPTFSRQEVEHEPLILGPAGSLPIPQATMPVTVEQSKPATNLRWQEKEGPFLAAVERHLATFLGPLASIITRKAASKVKNPEELLTLLASTLQAETDRQAFLARKNELLDGLGQIQPMGESLPTEKPAGSAVQPLVAGSVAAELTPAAVRRASELLARYVGPISRVLTERAAQRADSLRALYLILAEHLKDRAERARFLLEAGFPES